MIGRISGWLVIILVTIFYLKGTALSYFNFLVNEHDAIPFSAYFPFLFFALGAYIIVQGLRVIIFNRFLKK